MRRKQWVKFNGETIEGSTVESVVLCGCDSISVIKMISGHVIETTWPVSVRYEPEVKA